MPRISAREKARVLAQKDRLVTVQSRYLIGSLGRVYSQMADGVMDWLYAHYGKPLVKQAPINTKEFNAKTRAAIRTTLGAAYEAGYSQERELAVNSQLNFDAGNAQMKLKVNKYLSSNSVNRLSGFSQTDTDRVINYLKRNIDGLNDGSITFDDASKSMQKLLERLTVERVRAISRNVVASAYEQSRSEFWKDSDFDGIAGGMSWIGSIGGQHDRTWHNHIEDAERGGTFSVDSPYYGTIEMKHPNDFAYPAEAIFCMCTSIVKFERNVKLIGKKCLHCS